MIETIYLVLLITPAIVFLTAMVLYGTSFRWERTFQGRSMMGLLAALNLILGLNAVYALTATFTGTHQPWWIYASIAAFAVLTLAGIGFCISIVRSRRRLPKA